MYTAIKRERMWDYMYSISYLHVSLFALLLVILRNTFDKP